MRLRALELEQFRKFRRPHRLDGFVDGINVLCGPNEFGKSTILAAIRGLLFEKYSSGAQSVLAMRPWGSESAPRLAMEFEIGGGAWRIEKQFLHRPTARLTAPDGRRFDGSAAEEELQRVLGFGAGGKQGAKPGQMGVWAALWVTQRESVDQADLTSPSIRMTVAECLHGEVGVLTGGEKGRAVKDAARSALGVILDGNGKAKGRARELAARVAEQDALLAMMNERAARLMDDVAELRRLEAERHHVSDVQAERELHDELADARQRREKALLFQQKFEAKQSALVLAERSVADAEQEVGLRVTRAGELVDSDRQLAAAQARLGRLQVARDEHEALVRACRVAAAVVETNVNAADDAVRRAKAAIEVSAQAADLARLRVLSGQAAAAQVRARDLDSKAAALRIDRAAVAAVRVAEQTQDRVQSRLSAQATTVSFELQPEALARVRLDGASLASPGYAVALVEEGVILVEGIGVIRIRPAIGDRDALLDALRIAGDGLHGALAVAGATSLADAEAKLAAWERLRSEADAAAKEVTRLAPGDARARLEPGADALCRHVAAVEVLLAQGMAALGFAAAPDAAAAELALHGAVRAQSGAVAARVEAAAATASAIESLTDARVAFATVEGQVLAARADRERLHARQQAAEDHEPEAALAERSARAGSDRALRRAELAAIEAERPADTAAAMAIRIERLQKAVDQRQKNLLTLGQDIAGRRARIAHEGGVGLDEQIALTRRERDGAAAELEGLLREARILKLLCETLDGAERAARQAYLAPIVQRVTPYLCALFPGAQVQCDDDLRITGIVRSAVEEFGALSDGTREQIAVLARLAFAELLTDRGKPAMVILDDALAYSDRERMQRMFDILAAAAARTQILILSCREDLFLRIGGTPLRLAALD